MGMFVVCLEGGPNHSSQVRHRRSTSAPSRLFANGEASALEVATIRAWLPVAEFCALCTKPSFETQSLWRRMDAIDYKECRDGHRLDFGRARELRDWQQWSWEASLINDEDRVPAARRFANRFWPEGRAILNETEARMKTRQELREILGDDA